MPSRWVRVRGAVRARSDAFTAARSALDVHHLAVDEPARRHGIARRLMSAVETEARRQGVDDIRLDYWTFNAAAREFFGAMGYEPYNVRARLALEYGDRWMPFPIMIPGR